MDPTRWDADKKRVERALDSLRAERLAGRVEVIIDAHGVILAVDAFPDTYRRREYRVKRIDRRALQRVQSE